MDFDKDYRKTLLLLVQSVIQCIDVAMCWHGVYCFMSWAAFTLQFCGI